jgi:hypothetical protein
VPFRFGHSVIFTQFLTIGNRGIVSTARGSGWLKPPLSSGWGTLKNLCVQPAATAAGTDLCF